MHCHCKDIVRGTVIVCGGRVEIAGDPKDHSATEIIKMGERSQS